MQSVLAIRRGKCRPRSLCAAVVGVVVVVVVAGAQYAQRTFVFVNHVDDECRFAALGTFARAQTLTRYLSSLVGCCVHSGLSVVGGEYLPRTYLTIGDAYTQVINTSYR